MPTRPMRRVGGWSSGWLSPPIERPLPIGALMTLRRRHHNRVILVGMTHRVGPKGQVVIPKELRDELGIEPGDEVSFWRHDDHVALRPAHRRPPLQGRFVGAHLSTILEAERAGDEARER